MGDLSRVEIAEGAKIIFDGNLACKSDVCQIAADKENKNQKRCHD